MGGKQNLYSEAHTVQVRVGHDNLVGEVIRIEADRATIQVYEETGTAQSCLLDGYTNEIQPVSPSGILFSEPESLCPLS
jgi:hypothetical protein